MAAHGKAVAAGVLNGLMVSEAEQWRAGEGMAADGERGEDPTRVGMGGRLEATLRRQRCPHLSRKAVEERGVGDGPIALVVLDEVREAARAVWMTELALTARNHRARCAPGRVLVAGPEVVVDADGRVTAWQSASVPSVK